MNYITHLNTVFRRFSEDHELNPTHVSLYMSLFQFWNYNRFPAIFFINREEVMKMSKLGSRTTYQRCMNHLHKCKYIEYFPTNNPLKNSRVKLFKFGQSSGQSSEQGSEQSSEHSSGKVVDIALVPNINYIKPNKTYIDIPGSKKEVIDFFQDQKWCPREAVKFYNHYAAVGWRLGGKVIIKDWRAVAENWILKAGEKEKSTGPERRKSQVDYLKISNSKNYGKPL